MTKVILSHFVAQEGMAGEVSFKIPNSRIVNNPGDKSQELFVSLPHEQWRDIEGYWRYQISNKGRVFSKITNKLLSPGKCDGYHQVNLRKDGKSKSFRVSILVANAFLTRPNDESIVCHKDANRTNDDVENLYWGTYKTNATDRDSHGTTARGERARSAKLNEPAIKIIRSVSDQFSSKELSNAFGVSISAIHRIQKGWTWKHV